MYQKYSRHSELNRLIGAAAVSKKFRQQLLQKPEHVLEHGYLGYQFNLTAEEEALVRGAVAENIRDFSRQVWEWMGRDGHNSDDDRGNGHRYDEVCEPMEKLSQDALPCRDVFVDAVDPTAPLCNERGELLTRSFLLDSTILSWRDADMDPLILVVDDNREMAQGLQYALETEGFRVALALDGESAIKFLERERPSLILADIKMPRMDGYALLRLVKKNAEWRNIPFVFVTASADWREAVIAKSRGAQEYIVKPFELEYLIMVVRQLTQVEEKVGAGSVGESGGQAN